jgi:hypothetical protein
MSETDRYDCLLGGIRDVLEDLPEVRLSWIDAPPGRLGEPLHIGVVGTSESLSWVGDELRRRLAPVEAAFDLTIELHRYSRAELPTLDWENVALLSGVRPTKGEAGDRLPVTHADREQRALRMSHAIRRLLALQLACFSGWRVAMSLAASDLSACHKSQSCWSPSQKSALIPVTLANRRAVSGVTLLLALITSFSLGKETPS